MSAVDDYSKKHISADHHNNEDGRLPIDRFSYLREDHRQHWLTILRACIPRPILLLRSKIRFKAWFPESSVSPSSMVERGASLARGVVIHDAVIGGNVSIGAFSTVGVNSSLLGTSPIRIGSFCSIGPDCFFRSDNHDVLAVTTYPLRQLLHGEAGAGDSFPGRSIEVGSDVWFGRGVTVLAGAQIGSGCIVSAGSVVTGKTFPPFSVIGGIPARVLKFRFPQDVLEDLLASPWWEMPETTIFGAAMAELLAPWESRQQLNPSQGESSGEIGTNCLV